MEGEAELIAHRAAAARKSQNETMRVVSILTLFVALLAVEIPAERPT